MCSRSSLCCNPQLSCFFFFFSSRRRHTRCSRDWSSDVCSSDLSPAAEDALVQPAGRRGTADQIFFVRPDDHFERMLGRHMIFLEGLHHLNGRHRAHVAVKISSVGYGIDVRTKKNARRGRRHPGARPKNVSCGIDARLESSLTHRFHRVIPADRKSTRLNSSHGYISYAVFCLKKKKNVRSSYSYC